MSVKTPKPDWIIDHPITDPGYTFGDYLRELRPLLPLAWFVVAALIADYFFSGVK